MTITNGYTDLAAFKGVYYTQDSQADTVDDTWAILIINATSRKIDQFCGRRFWRTASDEARFYTAEFPDLLRIDDMIAAPTELATDVAGDRTYAAVWAATDYDLEPYNAPLEAIARPYTQIRRNPFGRYAFPAGNRGQAVHRGGILRGVRITGKFGFCATGSQPDMVSTACLLQAGRWFKRKDAIFGVMGDPNMGIVKITTLRLDEDVMSMLEDLVKPRGIRGV